MTFKKVFSKVIFSMTSEIDVTNSPNKSHSNALFSKKVQNWGLRPTSTVNWTQYRPFLLFQLYVRSCVALQSLKICQSILRLKNASHFCQRRIHEESSLAWDRGTLLKIIPKIGYFKSRTIYHKWLFLICIHPVQRLF